MFKGITQFRHPAIIRFVSLINQAIRAFIRHDMATYSAALAFHLLFSLFPFIIFLIALLGFFDMQEFFDRIRDQAQAFLPPPAMQQLNIVINEIRAPRGGLLSVGAVMALFLASRGTRALSRALNVVYCASESRSALKRYVMSLIYTLGLAMLFIVVASLLITGPQAMQWITHQIRLEYAFIIAWTWLRWPVGFLLLTFVVAVVYHVVPNVRHDFQLITAGSLLSVLVWIGASLAFRLYIQNFTGYSVMYGSIGAVIVLLFYLYLSSAVLLFGAEINAVIENRQ